MLATKHDKLPLIGPPLHATLGMSVETVQVDTDRLATFTGDVCRPGGARQTAVAKARLGMRATRARLGIASEGTFAPRSALPFVIAATEIVVHATTTAASSSPRPSPNSPPSQ